MHCHTLLQESMQAEDLLSCNELSIGKCKHKRTQGSPSELKEAQANSRKPCGDAEHSGVEEQDGTMQKAASACLRSKPLSVLCSNQTDAWVAQGNILTQPLNTCLST
jgi:hypothetical protein